MPLNCPLNKLDINECLKCSDNKDGYCWGLAPPKENRIPLKEILTIGERLTILENRFESHKYLEDEYDKFTGIEDRLIYLESLSFKIEKRLQSFQEAEDKYNTMTDTMNLVLSNFSKELTLLKKSKYSNNDPF
jgi:hypothetical protein